MSGHQTVVAFMLRQAVQRFESDCRSAQARIRNARDIEQVVRLRDEPHIDSIAASLRHTVTAERELEHAANARIRDLIKESLALVDAGGADAEAMLSRLRLQAYRILPGRFPSAARLLQVELARRQADPPALRAASPRP